MKISAVVNTYNEEKNIGRCLDSLKEFSDETVVVDMNSTDKTVEIAKKHKAKIFPHAYTRYVEPARNFAISKAEGDWILIIDADEQLSPSLAGKLKQVALTKLADYVEIPRKNIIFNKWINHSRWWPDYLIRFFKKGTVKFSNEIHVPPTAHGRKLKLEAAGELALIHYNFQTVSQYLERINRYSDIQSEELKKQDYKFLWKDLILKPSNEFLSRFFAGEGYKDGLHGLVLGLLQAFSELVVYLKLWEKGGFVQSEIKDFDEVFDKSAEDLNYWRAKTSRGLINKIRFGIKRKI